MRVLVALFAAFACVVAKPAAVNYAYSAIAPLHSTHWAGLPALSPLAYAAPWAGAHPWAAHSLPLATPWAHPLANHWAAPAGIKTQYHAQDELGQASYGHAEPGQTHNAIQDAAGNKVGSFSFVNPEGKLVETSYVADAAGYRVASNDLPVAPIDAGLVAPAPVADTPEVVAARVAHLAEVEAAKSRSRRSAVITPAATTPIAHASIAHAPIAHLPLTYSAPWAHDWALNRWAAPITPWSAPLAHWSAPLAWDHHHLHHAYPTTNTIPTVVGPNGELADTPEVTAAKINHFAEVAAAKARVGAW